MEVLPSHAPVKPPRKKNPSNLKSSVYQKEPKYKIASELTVPVLSQKKEQDDSRRESVKMSSEISSQLQVEPDSAATDPFLPRSSHYSSSKPQTLDPLNDSVPTPKTESQPVASDSFVLHSQSGAQQEYNRCLIRLSKTSQDFNFNTLFQEIKRDEHSFATF
jgi:hypothetical protein